MQVEGVPHAPDSSAGVRDISSFVMLRVTMPTRMSGAAVLAQVLLDDRREFLQAAEVFEKMAALLETGFVADIQSVPGKCFLDRGKGIDGGAVRVEDRKPFIAL